MTYAAIPTSPPRDAALPGVRSMTPWHGLDDQVQQPQIHPVILLGQAAERSETSDQALAASRPSRRRRVDVRRYASFWRMMGDVNPLLDTAGGM